MDPEGCIPILTKFWLIEALFTLARRGGEGEVYASQGGESRMKVLTKGFAGGRAAGPRTRAIDVTRWRRATSHDSRRLDYLSPLLQMFFMSVLTLSPPSPTLCQLFTQSQTSPYVFCVNVDFEYQGTVETVYNETGYNEQPDITSRFGAEVRSRRCTYMITAISV